jgi:hypothetical protein
MGGHLPDGGQLIKVQDDYSTLLKKIMKFQSGDKFEPLLDFLAGFAFQEAAFKIVVNKSNTQLVLQPLVSLYRY